MHGRLSWKNGISLLGSRYLNYLFSYTETSTRKLKVWYTMVSWVKKYTLKIQTSTLSIHFSGSQELHVAAPVNPAFNKFNSLDRRALNKRQNSNGLLKLVTPTSGPESLPIGKKYVVTNCPFYRFGSINYFSLFPHVLTVGRLTGAILNQFDRGNNKEPERRHSSYDSSTNR